MQVTGWNLPVATVTQDDRNLAPGTYPLWVRTETNVSNRLPFAVDTLPEVTSKEGNHSQSTAQPVTLPVIVNGRIEKPGQWDVFRFHGRAGDEVVAETIARRLDSPLDSVLKLTDAAGKQLAFNDDFEDKGAGLQTRYRRFLAHRQAARGRRVLPLRGRRATSGRPRIRLPFAP